MATMQATLQGWLDALGFDWKSGRVLVRDATTLSNAYGAYKGFAKPREALRDDPLLTRAFCTDFGTLQASPTLAFDETAIYFVHEYDGATSMQKICKDPGAYLDGTAEFDEYGF